MAEPLLRVEGVSKSFAGERRTASEVLRAITFEITAHEIVGMTGRSGCGKTTLLRILAGLETATAGTVYSVDRPILVFQDARVFPWRTVAEHFALLDAPHQQFRDEAVDSFGLGIYWNQAAWQLSIGTQKRLVIALALALAPSVLLLDEALSSVDLETKLRIEEVLRHYVQSRDAAVVAVSHDLGELSRLTNRVLVLQDTPAIAVEHTVADLVERLQRRPIEKAERSS